ncbi:MULTISPECIES: hypothetical protein [Rossellomorea]|uniref:hypothetical protein n=1 Tax=Rossellomorea TaxID=2837508 RepID=UPI001CCA78DC|nr:MULTISPECIES: hypothetical protein [Rossellomorea]MCA0149503.1 hypothetical protein [Rossellomorea vietnamensis]WGG46694.1 hypothetical protein P8596_05575 [Rossellomorea sp. DA94]
MLRILGTVFSLVSFVLFTYVLVMQEFKWVELMMLMAGLSFGFMGIEEIQRNHKGRGWLLLSAGLLWLYSSLQGFLFFH